MGQVNWRSIGLAMGGLIALAAAMGIGRFVYTPILPFMNEGLGLTPQAGGSIASANFLGYLAGALAAASPRLSGNARSWFLGALIVSAATSAAMAATTLLPVFLGLRFVSGLASAFVLVFSTTLVLERLAAMGRADLSAVHFAGVGIGIALSAVLVTGTASLNGDWRSLWFVSAVATAIMLGAVHFLVPPAEQPATSTQDAATNETAGGTMMNPALIRLVIAYGLFGFGYVITATFVSSIARSTPGLAAVEPYVWLIVGLCAAPSIFLWNRVSAFWGARAAFAAACVLEALGVAMTATSTQQDVFLLGAGLLGGTFMGITALGLVEARRMTADQGSAAVRRTLAVLTASFGAGQMIGPWLAGQLHVLTGSFQMPSLAAAGALIVAAALVVR